MRPVVHESLATSKYPLKIHSPNAPFLPSPSYPFYGERGKLSSKSSFIVTRQSSIHSFIRIKKETAFKLSTFKYVDYGQVYYPIRKAQDAVKVFN